MPIGIETSGTRFKGRGVKAWLPPAIPPEIVERTGGRIEIGTRSSRKEVTLEIRDDGCGIPAEIHARIFDPFFTTKPVGEGTGLGLSISHSIVSDHGGRIELESTPGRGACFRVTLPVETRGMNDQRSS